MRVRGGGGARWPHCYVIIKGHPGAKMVVHKGGEQGGEEGGEQGGEQGGGFFAVL